MSKELKGSIRIISYPIQNTNKEIEIIRKDHLKILDLKNKITKIEITQEGFQQQI